MLKKIDKKILYTTLILVFIGSFVFFSASLAQLKDTDFFISVFFKQVISIFLGLAGMFFIANAKFFNGTWLRKNSLYIFVFGFFLQSLVFFSEPIKGSQRWVDFDFFLSFQPSEFFKYSFIIFFSAVIVTLGKKINNIKTFLIFSFSFFVPLILFFLYIKDTGTLMTILFSSIFVLFISQVKYKNIFLPILGIFIFILPLLYFFIPHVHERINVFLNFENVDIQNEGYHLNQMLITIGSGEILGRGFGGSLQKFSKKIPEPFGDSIFAVYSEEFGFVGSVLLLLLFLLFLLFILSASKKIKNNFEKMVVVGLGIMIIFPVFYNIGSSLGVVPLSGMPITFISKGGTAIFSALIVMGVILALTRKRR